MKSYLISLLLINILLVTKSIQATTPSSFPDDNPPPFYVLDPHHYRSYFPDDESFQLASKVAPFLDLPANYHSCLQTFYYRIRSYRKHIYKQDGYWVLSEFLPFQRTIAAAAGHHIREGRWFWDAPEFIEDYIRYWYLGNNNGQAQPHIAGYTNWIYHAAWQYGLLWGAHGKQESLFRDTYTSAARVFRDVYVEKYLTNSTRNKDSAWNTTGRVCWMQEDGYDAMEVSVSGGGCRPTIASAMWAEAMALVSAGNLLGEKTEEFQRWAEFSQNVITKQHWNPDIRSFAVIPGPVPDPNHNPQEAHPSKSDCDLRKIRVFNQPVGVRELLAFMPWYFSSLLPASNATKAASWAQQFQYLLETTGEDGFTAPWGLRTTQRSSPCYNYSWDHGDCWNGPSWPYETSRVLTGLANLLVEYPADVITASQMTPKVFEDLLVQYARQHTLTRAVNDTAQPKHSGHIFENLHPDLGYWNNREQMYWRDDPNKNMGDDYNHSTFLDLLLNMWLGIRMPSGGDADWLTVHPLVQAPYFAADRVPYRGHVLSIVYDPTGLQYPAVPGRGFRLLVDGRVAAQRPDLGRLVVPAEPFDDAKVAESVGAKV